VLRHYEKTFARAVAIVYTGGAVAQLLHLLLKFGWQYMPFWVDWVLIVVGTYGGLGLLLFVRRVAWRGRWEQVVHGLIVAHLFMSILVHARAIIIGDHAFFTTFPHEYSYFALLYFAFFAWRSWTMKLAPQTGGMPPNTR
jgi:hypothetical protein